MNIPYPTLQQYGSHCHYRAWHDSCCSSCSMDDYRCTNSPLTFYASGDVFTDSITGMLAHQKKILDGCKASTHTIKAQNLQQLLTALCNPGYHYQPYAPSLTTISSCICLDDDNAWSLPFHLCCASPMQMKVLCLSTTLRCLRPQPLGTPRDAVIELLVVTLPTPAATTWSSSQACCLVSEAYQR